MKKAIPGERGATAKGGDDVKAVEAYLATVPEPARGTLNKLRAVIRSAAPAEATEGLSYGMPAFKYKGPLVAYASFANHCSLFPMSAATIEAFKDELTGYETAKGTIRFTVEKPLPAALVKRIVKARIADNEGKKRR